MHSLALVAVGDKISQDTATARQLKAFYSFLCSIIVLNLYVTIVKLNQGLHSTTRIVTLATS